MSVRIYVENLPAATTSVDLMNLFKTYGNVVDVNLVADRDNLKSLGFGFVTMVTTEGARAAVLGLNGKQIATRTIVVTEVRPPPSLGPGGVPGSPKPAEQYHPLHPEMKKNGIIPTNPGWADSRKAK